MKFIRKLINKSAQYSCLWVLWALVQASTTFAQTDTSSDAAASPSLVAQVETTQAAYDHWLKECVTTVNGEQHLNREKKWCIEERERLLGNTQKNEENIQRAKGEVHREKANYESTTNKICPNCQTKDDTSEVVMDSTHLQTIKELVGKALGRKDTDCKVHTDLFSLKCGKEIACNLTKSIFPSALLSGKISIFGQHECLKNSAHQTSCIGELFHGIYDDLFSNMKAITVDLPSMIWHAPGKIWDALFKVEKKSSDALLATTHLPDPAVKSWFASKAEFIQKFFVNFFKSIDSGIKSSYGCELWSGAPWSSYCLVPMESWNCATCEQRFSAICGIAGYLAGEIPSAYLIGGMFGVASEAASGMKKFAVSVYEKYPRTLKKPVLFSKEAVKVISVPFKALAWTLRGIRNGLVAFGTLKPITVVLNSKVSRAAVYPASQYINFISTAIEKGYQHSQAALYLTGLKTRTGVNFVMIINVPNPIVKGRVIPLDPNALIEIPTGPQKVMSRGKEYHFHLSDDQKSIIIDDVIDAASVPKAEAPKKVPRIFKKQKSVQKINTQTDAPI